jgi:hypothetical protein
MMKNKNTFIVILLFFFLTFDLFAVEGKIKIYVKGDDTVYTSQKVTVAVELMTDAFSITDAKITFPDSSKYIVQAPKSAEYLRTVDMNGSDWQLVHYEYRLYALRAGEIEVPSLAITFAASMGYGQPKKEFSFHSEPLLLKVKSPRGVKADHFVLVTDKYALKSEVKPKKKQLIVGDAIEFKITQQAHGVPDILLKPFVYRSTDKVRVYDKEPELKSGLKGDFDVSRTDSFTLVATAEGSVTIPAQESVWWNAQTKKVQKESIPAMTFEIIADPQIAIDAEKAEQKRMLAYLVLLAVLLLLFYRLSVPSLKRWLLHRKKMYEESEKGKFNNLVKSLDTKEYSVIYSNLYQWLAVVSPDPKFSRVGFKSMSELQPSFSKALSQLEEVLAVPERSFDKTDFINELTKFREVLLKQTRDKAQGLPLNINP